MCATKSQTHGHTASLEGIMRKSSKPVSSAFPPELKTQFSDVMHLRGQEALRDMESKYGSDPVLAICRLLNTSPADGLLGFEEDMTSRRHVFGTNEIPQKKPKTFLMLLLDALKDVTLIILMTAALISLALSFYHGDDSSFDEVVDSTVDTRTSVNDDMESRANWIEAVAIMGTVFIVAIVTALNNYQKEQQFRGLQARIESDQRFTIVRKGVLVSVPIKDIVVGDVCQLQYGDVIPADGLVVYSNDLKIDESSLTGESEQVKKSIAADPVLLSGTQVMEGSGRMVVVAVGLNSQTGVICTLLGITVSRSARRKQAFINFWKSIPTALSTLCGKKKKCRSSDSVNSNSCEEGANQPGQSTPAVPWKLSQMRSPLQVKLAKLSLRIGYIGVIAAVVTILVLILRFCIETFAMKGEPWSVRYVQVFVRFIILGVTVIVVSVPEGLPLAVTLALAYSVRQMMHDNNLVRHLDACETMGNATTICCDKTGTLTTNKMSVVDAYVAGKRFAQPVINDFTGNSLAKALPESVSQLVAEAICLNTAKTSNVTPSRGPGLPKYVGNRTECALLGFVLRLLATQATLANPIDVIRAKFPETTFVKVFTFNSKRKSMSSAIRLADGTVRLFVKGASEVVLEKCCQTLTAEGGVAPFLDEQSAEVNRLVIQPMACVGLRTVCVAYRDFPAEQAGFINWDDEDAIVALLTCIGIFGIADPVRPEVPEAIQKCQRAGVTVRMVTGDNIETARSVAKICGIIPNDDDSRSGALVLEGKEFNQLIRNRKTGAVEQALFDRVWPRLRVLARSTPEDKFNLVGGIINSKLNPIGEVVAVTGDGTNDAPALREADVGFAMGLSGTDVAKEASDIILTDDNFASLVKALIWGRNVYDSIAKFIQFQLTVNIVASLVTVVAAAVVEDAVITAIQMLYVNLLMDTLASLALSTEPPSSTLLNRPPYGRTRPLVSATMAKNIILNAAYQLSVLLFLTFYGEEMLKIESGRNQRQLSSSTAGVPTQHFTVIFNVLVLMTLFNEICARRLHNERNPFSGLHRSKIFLCIWIGSLVSQVLVIEFGGVVFRTAKLTFDQWLWCGFFGVGQLLWGQLCASIPLERCHSFSRWFGIPAISEAIPSVLETGDGASPVSAASSNRKSRKANGNRSRGASESSSIASQHSFTPIVVPQLETNF